MQRRRLVMLFALGLVISPIIRPIAEAQERSGEVLPEGTELQLILGEPLSSKLNDVGDEVYATVRRDVVVDGRTVLPKGTEIIGRVTLVQPAKRMMKGGKLHVTFERIRLDGRDQRLAAVIKSATDFRRDEKVETNSEGTLKEGASGGEIIQNIGTGAMIGGIGATVILLGSSRGGSGYYGYGGISSGGAIAAAGVLGGSVIASILLSKGKEVRLDEGAIIRIRLERPLAIG